MEKNWSIRDYEDGDEQRILPLFNFIFNKKRSFEHWDWEFAKSPEGFKALVAIDDGSDVIAHLAALSREMKIGQVKAQSALEVDGMTHPDYARCGVFVALGNRLLSDLEKEEVGIVMGFPNENALPGHRKMGCVELFTSEIMIKPINFKNILEKMFSNRLLVKLAELFGRFLFRVIYRTKKVQIEKDVTIKEINEFDNRFDKFWEDASSIGNIILTRNQSYLNWRYAECPDQDYSIFIAEKDGRVMGYVALRVMDLFGLKNGAIVDILALPNHTDIVQSLVLAAVENIQKQNVDLIACMMPKWSEYNRVLRKCGFMPCPKRLNPKPQPFIVYPLSKEIDLEVINNPHNWFITWGDMDVV